MAIFLMIDNYDSFVHNLVRYFEELKQTIIVRRNDEITLEEISGMGIKGIIISPDPGIPKTAGISMYIIKALIGF